WPPEPDHSQPDGINTPALMGHVLVQLDQPYQEAEILGFTKPIATQDLSLNQLQPLADLVDTFLAPAPEMTLEAASEKTPAANSSLMNTVILHSWFEGRINKEWQKITKRIKEQWSLFQGDALVPAMGMRSVATPTPIPNQIRHRIEALYSQEFGTSKETIDYDSQSEQTDALLQIMQTTQSDETRWQAAELLWSVDPQHPQSPVLTLKDLGVYLNKQTIALMVGLLPKDDGSFLILTRACPMATATALPPGLNLTGWDENKDPFFNVEARQRDQYVQFKFTAERGDRFSLKVTLNGHQFTESFTV
ncbi:MAG: DUF1822 family protein, partial [Chloroflexota bacterium]